MKITLILIIIVNLKTSYGQTYPGFPCPNIFEHFNIERPYGFLQVYNMQINKNNSVEVQLTHDGSYIEVMFKLLEENTNDVIDKIKEGKPISYVIQFSPNFFPNKVPEVLEIKVNNNRVCKNSQIVPSRTITFYTYLMVKETLNDTVPKLPTSNLLPPSYFISEQPGLNLLTPSSNHQIIRTNNTPASRKQTPEFISSQPETRSEPQSSHRKLNPLYSHLTHTCGTTLVSTRLVFGGTESERGAWPWLTALFKTTVNEFVCGGNLISRATVVTAAHCFGNDTNLEHYLMGVGVHNLKKMNDEESLYLKLKEIVIHDKYDSLRKRIESDIAIVILETKVNFNKNIRPICLWYNTDELINQESVVVGWGLIDPENSSNIPRYVKTKTVSLVNCLLSHQHFPAILSNETTFCATGLDKFSGPCRGDSGGGLIFEKNSKWFLKGIVSEALQHGTKVCDLNHYVVYTDVPKFINWIEDIMIP